MKISHVRTYLWFVTLNHFRSDDDACLAATWPDLRVNTGHKHYKICFAVMIFGNVTNGISNYRHLDSHFMFTILVCFSCVLSVCVICTWSLSIRYENFGADKPTFQRPFWKCVFDFGSI